MKLLYPLVISLLLQACGGGGAAPPADEAPAPSPAPPPPVAVAPPPAPAPAGSTCSIADQRLVAREFMQEQYFWYSQLRTPDEAAANQDAYFQSMLVKPLDRYSYTQSAASFSQVFTEGRRTGYGYTFVWDGATPPVIRIRNTEPLSPAAKAGLSRGDTVLAIDGHTPEQIVTGLPPAVTTPGVPRVFRLRSPAGVEREITVMSADYALSPVAATATFDVTRGGAPVKVGYIAYNQFVTYGAAQLNQAFSGFSAAGVTEVILDLRYNGGGSVGVSRDLASLLGGNRTAGSLFAYLRFNDKLANFNRQINFNTTATPLAAVSQGLPRVVIIASGSTASASELLINGLRPFTDVVLVGETTYGKPYGFVPQYNCGIFYNAVQFDTLNAAGVGGYTAGLSPTCQVADDLDRQLGDPNERRTRVALDYVATGSCGVQAQGMRAAGPPAQVLGETTPNQMFIE